QPLFYHRGTLWPADHLRARLPSCCRLLSRLLLVLAVPAYSADYSARRPGPGPARGPGEGRRGGAWEQAESGASLGMAAREGRQAHILRWSAAAAGMSITGPLAGRPQARAKETASASRAGRKPRSPAIGGPETAGDRPWAVGARPGALCLALASSRRTR